MDQRPDTSIARYFSDLPDPRVDRQKRHGLTDLLTIAICAVICGADGWVEVEQFGEAKVGWFKTFLDLPHGIASHDTFGRVFAALDPVAFEVCFMSWVKSLCEDTAGDIVAIDGKTLRRSFDQAAGKTALHMVSAWAADSGLTLGQIATEQKSNGITAIPRLLELLDIRGATVTIDAMGCQKDIAGRIIDREGDYMLGLKGNQGTLHDEVKLFMDEAVGHDFAHMRYDFYETVDGDHGRIEHRKTWCTDDVDWFKGKDRWPVLRSFVMVESQHALGEKTTCERRYFISSLDGKNAKRAAHAIRSHWGIENSVHWILDVAFDEDRCRVRQGNAAKNMSLLRRIALNLLKNHKSIKVGIKTKRLRAGWDEQYLLNVLTTTI